MPRTLVDPNLRYVSLAPGPGRTPWFYAGAAVVAAMGAAITTGEPALIFASPVVGVLVGYLTGQTAGPFTSPKKLHAVPLAVVPWGVVIDPDRRADPVPWGELRHVERTRIERGRERRAMTVLGIDTDAVRLQGMAPEDDWHRRLPEVWRDYARESIRPIALDLDGAAGARGHGLFDDLLQRARHLLESREGAEALRLPHADYRSVNRRVAGPETLSALRSALASESTAGDTAPRAAVLCAELGAKELLGQVLSLVMSPSPLVAAVSKAAALRLGAAPFQPGAVREVMPFLQEPEVSAIERWSAPR